MEQLYPALIIDALKTVRYPGTGKNIVEAGMVEDDIRIDGNKVSFSLVFDRPTDPFIKSLVKAAEQAVLTFASKEADVRGNVAVKIRQAAPAPKPDPLPGVKNIVAVASGKGGVGKSTVAANLAVSLAAEGYKVGLLDADIFGPSVPKMFNAEDAELYVHPVEGRGDLIIPLERFGIKLLSIGFVVDKDSAVLWRGSMASNALKQLIEQADWGELDYFVIDMPPGTSDIHLTLVQTLGITGAVVVSTPQEIALADARKAVSMFRGDKVNVPILGIVENMAWFTPAEHPDERYYIFGKGGASRLAEQLEVPLLAEIPLVAEVGDHNDAGTPLVADEQADPITAQAFRHLARNVIEAVDIRNKTLPPTQHVQMK